MPNAENYFQINKGMHLKVETSQFFTTTTFSDNFWHAVVAMLNRIKKKVNTNNASNLTF